MAGHGRLACSAEGAVSGAGPRGERNGPLTTTEARDMEERNHVLLKMILGAGIGCMLAVGSASGVVLAQGTAAEEQTLEKKATTLNGMPASPKLDEARVQALAKEFNVAPSVVEGLRNQKQGWGGTTLERATANHPTQTVARPSPTMS